MLAFMFAFMSFMYWYDSMYAATSEGVRVLREDIDVVVAAAEAAAIGVDVSGMGSDDEKAKGVLFVLLLLILSLALALVTGIHASFAAASTLASLCMPFI